MNVRTYCPSVRVGNWSEDLQLEEVEINIQNLDVACVDPWLQFVNLNRFRVWRNIDLQKCSDINLDLVCLSCRSPLFCKTAVCCGLLFCMQKELCIHTLDPYRFYLT